MTLSLSPFFLLSCPKVASRHEPPRKTTLEHKTRTQERKLSRLTPHLASTGDVDPEPRVRGTSCGSLTLEVGKSPTATRWRAELPVLYEQLSAISEFTSSSSCSWSLNRAVLETGANMVSRTKERALDPLLVPALLALATPSIC